MSIFQNRQGPLSTTDPAISFARKAISWWLPLLYLLISAAFYLRTYDSAQVKITLVQMGGLSLIGLWLSLLLMEGRKAFQKEDFVSFAPFIMYLGYIIVSFYNVPYKGASLDDFVRYIFYMSAAIIVITEFDEAAVNRLTKILIITTWIVVGYGIVQVLDTRNPAPMGERRFGLDPFVWAGAFGPRVFSTYGNPNFFADFALFIFFILAAQYLKTRSFSYIPLIVMDLACLYFTETKGAWVGFGVSFFIAALIYSVYFLRDYYETHRLQINGIALGVLLFCLAVVGQYALKRMHSVNFRVFTWLSTWEMIETHPLVGTGVGCFKIVYPAFRRPQIFHIEAKHNTETDHAENEHLEQWLDNGVLGFGLFVWLAIFTIAVGLRALKIQNLVKSGPAGRAPPIAYDLLGYLTAFIAMLCHNFFDVSMRFVSSGVFLGLFSGLVINLARGKALYELRPSSKEQASLSASSGNNALALGLLRLVVLGGLVWLVYIIFSQFSVLQGPYSERMVPGESLQWNIAWAVLFCVVIGLAYVFGRIVFTTRSWAAIAVIGAMLYPLYYFWGFFKADIYHNLAIFHSKQSDWDNALSYYSKSNKFNPDFIMPYYFQGNVFKDRFNMQPQVNQKWGDKEGVPRTDFERAVAAYEQVRKIAPNYVQMHYHMGELYLKMADLYMRQNEPAKAAPYLDKALARFNLYHNLDPVFPYTYYRRAWIYNARKDYEKAEKEYQDNIAAADCGEKNHKHETPEAYNYLGGGLLTLNRVPEAAAAFKRALELDPNYGPAKSNYEMIKARYPSAVSGLESSAPEAIKILSASPAASSAK